MCPAHSVPALESSASTSQSSPMPEHADFPTLLDALTKLTAAMYANAEFSRQLAESNQQLIEALIQQGQEEEKLPATTYMSGKRIK